MRLFTLSFIALAAPAWAAPTASAPSGAATSRPAARRPAAALPDEPGGPVPGAAREEAGPLPPVLGPARAAEYRFDALRIDGTLRGPEALDVGSGLSRDRKPLARLRRSFVHRVFETVEAPGLHGGH